jgi:hypothetical protein
MELTVVADTARLERDLKTLKPAAIRRAMRWTLNRAGRELFTLALKKGAGATGMNQKLVRKRLRYFKPTARAPRARLWVGGNEMPLSHISNRLEVGAGVASAGKVSVRARGLFKATVKAGKRVHTGPFVRKAKAANSGKHTPMLRKRAHGKVWSLTTRRGRLPIQEIKFDPKPALSAAVARVVASDQGRVLERAAEAARKKYLVG